MLHAVLVDLGRLLLAEVGVVVALDAPRRKTERDGLLTGRDTLLEHGLVLLPLLDDEVVGPAPVVHDAESLHKPADLLAVSLGVGVALDLRDVADDELHAPVHLGPLGHGHGRKVEALRLAGVYELRGPHPVAEAERRALGEAV